MSHIQDTCHEQDHARLPWDLPAAWDIHSGLFADNSSQVQNQGPHSILESGEKYNPLLLDSCCPSGLCPPPTEITLMGTHVQLAGGVTPWPFIPSSATGIGDREAKGMFFSPDVND